MRANRGTPGIHIALYTRGLEETLRLENRQQDGDFRMHDLPTIDLYSDIH
ncbi:MAG: hypothetical protein NVSMB22_26990 [Chloroflexota bacterium]